MKKIVLAAALALLASPWNHAWAIGWRKDYPLQKVNHKLKGKIVDFTFNHGVDNRMWSRSLGQKRDLYIYQPPGYTRSVRYPVMILMHGFAMDEQSFLDLVPYLDDAMVRGKLPPMIIAVPDGTVKGEPSFIEPGSFFLNSEAGSFEDFVLHDVWDFVCARYPIREERQAHVLAGFSMGGFAAFNFGIRYRRTFGVVAGIFPPLNLRWMSEGGDYFDDFDPRYWAWRDSIDPRDVIGKAGVAKIRLGDVVGPLYGVGPDAVHRLACENPIELIDRSFLRDGQLAMFVGYAGKDEYNIDAQVESFLYLCKFRGITVHVGYDPDGRHNAGTALRLLPGVISFLRREVGPYAPVFVTEPCVDCPDGACTAGACLPEKK